MALELLRLYQEHEAVESVTAIQNWVVENHPESAAARQIRLDLARVAGDPERLVGEIEKALLSVDELEREDVLELHREAARIWASEHEAEKALAMLMPILDQDEVLASDLYDAGALAAYAGKQEQREQIVAEVSKRLDEFTRSAIRGQARSFGYSMVGEALSTQGREAESIEAHRESLRAATDHLPEVSVEALTRTFLEEENHRGLVAIKELQYDFTEADEDKASLGVDVARLYMDQLDDLEKAEATFQKCLDWDENCLDAMAGLWRPLF